MARPLLLCVLCLSFLCATAQAQQRFLWQGGTNNFSDPLNWNGGLAPTNNPETIPCSTTTGNTDINIISTVDAGTYFLGEVLNLPPNGVLQLAADGAELVFTDITSTQGGCSSDNPSLSWVDESIPTKRNDFYCHENWLADGLPAESAPCANDDVVFPSGESYYVTVAKDVNLVALHSVTYGGLSVKSASSSNPGSLLPLQNMGINLLNNGANVVINSTGSNYTLDNYCKPLNSFFFFNSSSLTSQAFNVSFPPSFNFSGLLPPGLDPGLLPPGFNISSLFPPGFPGSGSGSSGSAPMPGFSGYSCTCFSSCPTPQMTLMKQFVLRENIQQQGIVSVENMYYRNVVFSGTYTAASLNVYSNVPLSSFFNPTVVVPQLRAAANSLNWTISIANVTISSDGGALIVSGNVGYLSMLAIPGSPPILPNPLLWMFNATAPPASANKIAVAIQQLLGPLLINDQNATLASLITVAQSASGLPRDVITNLNTFGSEPNAGLALTRALTNPCFAACSQATDCSACLSSLTATLLNGGFSSPAQLAQSIINVKSSLGGSAFTANLNSITSLVSLYQQAASLKDVQNSVTPRLFTFALSPMFYLGRTRTLFDQLAAVQSYNKPRLASFFQQLLLATQMFGSVNMPQLDWVSAVPVQISRRRRAVIITVNGVTLNIAVTPSAVALAFGYSVRCLPSDTVCQAGLPSSGPVYANLFNLLSAGFDGFALSFPPCMNYDTLQFNNTCLSEWALGYCAQQCLSSGTTSVARTRTSEQLLKILSCGVAPSFPSNNTCLGQDGQISNSGLQLISSISSSCDCARLAPPPAPGGTGTGGGSGGSSGGGSSTGASSGSDGAGGGGAGLGMAAGAAGGGAALVIIIIVVVVLYRRKQKKTKNAAGLNPNASNNRTVVAFENPMYDDPAKSAQPTYEVLTPQMEAAAEGLYDEPAFQSTVNRSNPLYTSQENLAQADYADANNPGYGYLDVNPELEKQE